MKGVGSRTPCHCFNFELPGLNGGISLRQLPRSLDATGAVNANTSHAGVALLGQRPRDEKMASCPHRLQMT